MIAYILRRLMLVVPTLFGIMVVNFFIIQAAPGGPVEQMLSQIQGTAVDATEMRALGFASLRLMSSPAATSPRSSWAAGVSESAAAIASSPSRPAVSTHGG